MHAIQFQSGPLLAAIGALLLTLVVALAAANVEIDPGSLWGSEAGSTTAPAQPAAEPAAGGGEAHPAWLSERLVSPLTELRAR
jgi:uncharacterized membrane protein YdfJ with MMPL/SSD domain